MEKHELTCIGCPLGCSVKITLENNIIISVEGNTCNRLRHFDGFLQNSK